ncbi:hypothetical protein GCM10008983_12870 [Lentibacillus halophilus]|uniref:DUF2812 domain-containing protein n=1 Tax=Lentibacillus halophilus TaxID=295065 RepID=A0ABN0Z7U9_9BACI
MTIQTIRPFWSYDIAKTEKWLGEMAAHGYHFIRLRTQKRQFVFEKGEPKDVTFRIQYDKNTELPAALENDGWHLVWQHRKWQILRNDQPAYNIRMFPIRDGLMKRNKVLMYVFGSIFLYHIFTLLMPLLINGLVLMTGGSIHVVGSPFWAITIAYLIVVWGLVPYSFIKLYRSLKRLQHSHTETQNRETFFTTTGRIVTKWKFGWNYAPDKLEQWLRDMEEDGYNLTRISMAGLRFHFQEGEARKVSYCVDYQNSHRPSYFDMHKQAGWQLMYTSDVVLAKWAIWAKEYQTEEAPPTLYSDRTHMLKHAKRIMITYMALFGPVVLMFIGLIMTDINLVQTDGMDISWLQMGIFSLLIMEYSFLMVKSWLYYRRIKRRVDEVAAS